MNLRHLLAAALFAPLAAFALDSGPLPGTQATVTITLAYYGTARVSETAEKLVTYSYKNRDLLTELLEEGALGPSETSIKNWKLVVVDRTPLETDEDSTLVFYAVKNGATPVLIPSSRLGLSVGEVGVDAEVTKRNAQLEVTSRKNTFKNTVNFSGAASAETYDYSYQLDALASGADFLAAKSIKVGSEKFPFTFNLLGAITFKPVLGVRTDHLDGDARTPVEGSIGFSAFSPIDITNYPAPNNSF